MQKIDNAGAAHLTLFVAQHTLGVHFLQAREAGKAVRIGRGPATVIG
ncbi:MAG: hypothetical protein JWO71_950 [Candidatus Acidoferrum typicum]|nr:hypothetical protein [Candidatus Acidoferrum typicum]